MKKITLITLLICTITISHAQYFNAPITLRLNNKESAYVDNATVYEIFKDSRGFMWFASDRGLHCYGGVTSREFRYIAGRHRIIKINETFEGLFFLFDDNGRMGCFDRQSECFIPAEFENKSLDGHANNFHFSHKTGLYASNSSGLYAIDYRIENRGRDGKLILMPRHINQIKQPLHQIASDSLGQIYGVERKTLDIVRFNPETGTVKRYDINIEPEKTTRTPYQFFVLNDIAWMTYSWNGMLCYDLKTETQIDFNAYDTENQLNVDYGEIRKALRLDDNNFCFATWNGLVNVHFNGRPAADNYQVVFSPFINDQNGTYIEPRTTALYADTTNRILWTGTFGGGIVKYGDALDTYINIPKNQIYSITEDKRGYIWLTSAREGVMRSTKPKLDPTTTFTAWLPSSMERQRYTMYNDGERYIWLADKSGKLIRVDQYTEEKANFQVTLDGQTPLSTRINDMLVDSHGHLWLASDNRLIKWDQQSEKFELIKIQGLPNTTISKLIEDRQGIFWLGTLHGLFMLEQNSITDFTATGGYEKKVDSDPSEVYALNINGKGDIIATYSDKLLRIGSLNKDQIELFLSIDNGLLPCGHILKILDDKYGNTWLGANTRIMTIKSGGSNIFSYSTSTNNRDGCRLRDGRLVWTASEGVTYFSPEQAQRKSMSEEFVVSRVKVHDKDVFSGDKIDGIEIFNGSVNDVSTLVFGENQTDFQIFVSDLSYTPFQKQLLYKLEPLMTDWRTHSAEGGIMFPGLHPGEYKLHIKALFLDESQGNEQVFTIIIRPNWYNTRLAKILFLLTFAVGTWGLIALVKRRWQDLKRKQVHRVFEAINSRTDQDVVDSVGGTSDESHDKMLIIGGDKEMTTKLSELFEDQYDVCHSSNSGDAIIDTLFHLPRVVLCLFSMPNAVECCTKIKNNDRTCPIPFIFIDNEEDATNRIAAIEARADDYVPFDGTEGAMIVQVVSNRIAGREAIHQIYSRALTDRKADDLDDSQKSASVEDHFTISVNEMIQSNLKDPEFSVKKLSELMGMSQSTLYRRLMSSCGRTVIEAIRDARMRKAAELLYDGRLTIQAISEEVGYLDVATFRKHFFDLYGVNPSRFTKQQ